MQGNDPILALLGLFILSTTFFFCGKEVVTSPPPAALENRTTIPPPAPKISEPPPSSSSAPPVSAPMGLNGRSDERFIGQTSTYQIVEASPLSDGKMLANTVAAMLHKVPTVGIDVSGHRNKVGFGHEHELFSEQRAQSYAEDLLSRRMAVDQPTPNEFHMSRLVARRSTDEWSWQHGRIEWFIGTEGEQP